MRFIKFKISAQQRPYIVALVSLFILLFHQNCSQPGAISVSGSSNVGDLGTGGTGGGGGNPSEPTRTFSSETFANTELNTPVEFLLEKVTEEVLTGVRLTTQQFVAVNGTLELIDSSNFKFKYTPNTGYRGSDFSLVNGVDSRGRNINFNVKVVIANPVQNLKPALAIRGIGCIQCHSKVDSNIVTDFGYGNDYYFGVVPNSGWWQGGGVYGDHGQSISTMDLKAGVKVLVPKAMNPGVVTNSTGKKTLQEYVQGRLTASSSAGTRAAIVEEKTKVYIGSPTALDIERAFSMKPDDRLLYFKNGDSSVALSGIKDKIDYFKNDGMVTCEGDLALRGPVYFENLKINSATGCRIYVIGSVFIYGRIDQINTSENRNLQITSTKSISMGLGLTKKETGYCEPDSRFANDPGNYNVSSLKNRYVTFWTVPGFFVRGVTNPVQFGDSILTESRVIETGEGSPLWDAGCRDEGRNVSFDRLFLNAPAVHSRYEGNFIGTIIAEYSIMSLGAFKFQYDAVFDRTPLLPMLKHEVYLDIQ